MVIELMLHRRHCMGSTGVNALRDVSPAWGLCIKGSISTKHGFCVCSVRILRVSARTKRVIRVRRVPLATSFQALSN